MGGSILPHIVEGFYRVPFCELQARPLWGATKYLRLGIVIKRGLRILQILSNFRLYYMHLWRITSSCSSPEIEKMSRRFVSAMKTLGYLAIVIILKPMVFSIVS